MYIVTTDFTHILRINGQSEAIRMADNIKGHVYLPQNGANHLVYSYE